MGWHVHRVLEINSRSSGPCKTFAMEHFAMLEEIQRNGGVAQIEYASELLTRMSDNPQDSRLYEEAHSLYDAYVNDPYLTRNQD